MRIMRMIAASAALALSIAACTNASTPSPATTAEPPSTTAAPLATTLAPLPTTSLATTTTTAAPPEVVTVWADESTVNTLEAIAADFTANRGVAVEIRDVPFTSIRNEVLAAAAEDEVPDLFVGAHAWAGALVDAGAVAPIRGIPQTRRDAFIAPALEAFRLDGALYGIPYAAESIAL